MSLALFPGVQELRQFDVRLGSIRPGTGRAEHAVYMRRRLVVALVALGLIIGIAVLAHSVLADRGGVPASTPAIRLANLDAVSAAVANPDPVVIAAPSPGFAGQPTRYIVQPGDSLWSLSQRFRGSVGMSTYVSTLVAANGGSTVRPGQLLELP